MSAYTDLADWYVPQGGRSRVVNPLAWEIGRKGSGLWVTVPNGFLFEVSTPRLLRWYVRPTAREYQKAACLHDYALHVLGWDRVSAAALFSEALRADGVGRTKRLIIVLGVIVWKWK